MKRYILSLIAIAFPTLLFAQQEITASEAVRQFSKGSHYSFQIQIPQTHVKGTAKDWNKYLKNISKKVDEVNGEVVATNANYKNISTSPFTVFSKMVETPTGVVLTAWFAEHDSDYIAKDSIHRDWAVQKFMRDFAVDEYKAAVQEELDGENEKLKKLQKDLAGLIKDQEKSVKNVNGDMKDIEKDEKAIKDNEKDQASKGDQLDKQKQIVETLKSTPGQTLEDGKKTLKGYQSDLKKLVSENDKLKKDIEKQKADIKKEEKAQADNQKAQADKNAEIEKQQATIKTVEEKLASIK